MKSTIQLFNTALGRLGGEQIPYNRSPHEQDATGILCENLFPHVLDMVLEAHEWGFATRRVYLARLPEQQPVNPAYVFRYAMPADCVKPVSLEGYAGGAAPAGVNRTPAYLIEGNAILTNKRNAELVYIARIEEPRAWPPSFADVLAWALAGELASARINDSQKQNWCYQNYEVALAKAAARDRAKQNPHRKQSSWLVARGNGPSELNNFGLLDGGE